MGLQQAPGQGFTVGDDGPEFTSLIREVLDEPQLIVLGRVTYNDMAGYWPEAGGPVAERMNSHPKLVFSRTLSEPLSWSNARLATRQLAEEITALKAGSGPPLRAIGSITLAKDMMALNLVDRLRLVVFPRILGSTGSQPMFAGCGDTPLRPRHDISPRPRCCGAGVPGSDGLTGGPSPPKRPTKSMRQPPAA